MNNQEMITNLEGLNPEGKIPTELLLDALSDKIGVYGIRNDEPVSIYWENGIHICIGEIFTYGGTNHVAREIDNIVMERENQRIQGLKEKIGEIKWHWQPL